MSLSKYVNYKYSGADWLGDIPDHWRTVPLWTLFRRTKRTGCETEQLLSVYRDFGVIPKASRDDNNNKASDDLSVYQLVEPGDLAVNKMKAWQGSVAISEYRGIVSPAYFIYEAIHKENARYLHYLLRSPRYITGYLAISKGIRVNQWDLEPQYHSRMPVVLPTNEEQFKIATLLDRETGKIDVLIAEQEKLLTLLAEKRQAIISHAVTKGLNPDVPMKDSGVEWLGEVPAHWEVSRVKYYCSVRGRIGFRGYTTEDQVNEGDGALVLGATQITNTGQISLEAPVYISWEKYFESPEIMVESGDVLMVQRGSTCGKVGFVSADFGATTINPSIVLPKEICTSPRLLFLFLSSSVVQNFLTSSLGKTAIPMLSQEQIGNLAFCVPPKSEQVSIIEFVQTKVSQLDSLTTKAELAIELLKERRSALISAAVTGKIDVRNAVTEEVAA